MNYERRIAELRRRMDETGIDLVYLTRGANLFYLAGIRRPLEHGTDHNAYGDWACGAYIGRAGGIELIAPRMGGSFYEREAADKPWIAGVRLIQEAERPIDVLSQTLKGFGTLKHVAVDERTWAQQTEAIRETLPEARVSLASSLIAPMRMIKDADELVAMQRASAMADLVFARSLPILRAGVTEFEVAREIDYQFQLAGAEYTSFETGITFTGAAAASAGTMRTGQRTLMPGDSVTFDFGCVLDGYCSDFGRSAFFGEPPAEYVRVHEVVLESQATAMRLMKAGACTAAQANAAARKVIADAGYDTGFTHRLGHGIGVTVHEAPFLDFMDHTVLQENMCFTVEPSIRMPGRFGNRVEDVVLITANGGVSLNQAPHTLTIVE
ncbi:MAG TPA: Xaa-Pro peptidase family protein [Roseiflexaceae bacterium]|nr:Xaa-Pro peptidase family protein [Roseiflexaceae bacterium]HMP39953.1 Xaa-Pro peptidase family protein [Roseiflexaceae bacterium]